MRILIMSNSPFCSTGYGQTTAAIALNLKAMGHDVGIFAFYGLEGTKIEWNGIPIYPNNPRDWGTKNVKMFYDHFKADILLTLIDVWVLKDLDPSIRWCAIVPIDHNPVPPQVVDTIKSAKGMFKVLVEARFGQKQLELKGIPSDYISHATDTNIFINNKEWRDFSRESYGWKDKFVVGTVATNHNERKNWVSSLKAIQMFEANHKGEIVYYMHTNPLDERGINLHTLRLALGVQEFTFCPPRIEVEVGIDSPTLSRAYNMLDVFLLPSKGEGFGVPLIEAQACAIPVITTKCTAQEELLGGGWFIEKLIPTWTPQNSWNFECDPMEIVERLEQAYQAKKDGSIDKERTKARKKALDYSSKRVFNTYWPPILEGFEERLAHPERFKGHLSYKKYYEVRIEEQEAVEQAWANYPTHIENQCGLWHEGNRTDISERMIKDVCKGRKVLAVGASRMGETTLLSNLDADITRTDLIPDENIIEADVENLPFERRSYDVVICRDVIEHVKDEKKAMREMFRVLRNKGYLFISCPNRLAQGMDGLEHVRAWSPKEFERFLDDNGYKIIDKRGSIPNLYHRQFSGLYHEPESLPEFKETAKGFDENPISYYVGTQFFVLAQKK